MATRQQNAREFVKTWSSPNKGREDADRQTFWNDLLQRVYGINDYYNYITYEKDVQVKAGGKVTTRRIDGYIPSTKVMIEMKGKKVKDLTKPLKQSGGGGDLTPFEQAKRYANFLPNSEQPRWILVSNFNEIDIHDMEKPLATPTVIKLSDLPQKVKLLEFIVNASQQKIIDEKKLSVDAGNLVAKIYHELTNAYAQGRGVDVNSPEIQRSLNMLIVRLVFLLYADDSNLFGKDNIFQAFIERREPRDIRRDLSALFKVLDQPESERDPYLDDEFNQFAYVNGGMFSDENVIIPQFTDELKRLIVEEAGAGFDWSGISPTIFGAVFESTLNPETRRSGGMHYTSIENIHKVIDPLFLNDLHDEFDKIQNMGNNNQRVIKAREFREKIGKLKFFDPACGSGNFLTETYLSLRKMENECLRIITGDQGTLAITDDSDPKVKIQNFYGIEINDFAVSVARTAMWIAESQMWEQTKDITFANKDFLPLDSNDSIYEGNALQMDWSKVVKLYELNYIMGNPPFVGNNYMTVSQKSDLHLFFNKSLRLDYVTAFFVKCCQEINGTSIHCAFVSTNSITQGTQVPYLWNELFKYGFKVNFAYRSFKWNNEASQKAQVVCVIIGFSCGNDTKQKVIFHEDGSPESVSHISPYLNEGSDFIVQKHNRPLTNVPRLVQGNEPKDGGNFIFNKEIFDKLRVTDPIAVKYSRKYMMGKDFLHNGDRYCLWLVNAKPSEILKSKFIKQRVDAVREYRLSSKAKSTQKKANYSFLFAQISQSNHDYIAIPRVTSDRRDYIPIGFLSANVISGDKLYIIPNGNKYMFGILMSSLHNSWMRTVAGRLGTGYSYTTTMVYNTFPWPNVDDKQKKKISKTAQAILDARKLYPDSSLADLYDPLTMPAELRKAHEANDKAVLQAYGLKPSASESEIVQHLFKLYEELTRKDKRNHE